MSDHHKYEPEMRVVAQYARTAIPGYQRRGETEGTVETCFSFLFFIVTNLRMVLVFLAPLRPFNGAQNVNKKRHLRFKGLFVFDQENSIWVLDMSR